MRPHRIFSIRSLGALSLALLVSGVVPVAAAAAAKPKVLILPYSPLYDSIPRATGEQIARTLEDGLKGNGSIQLLQAPTERAAGGPTKGATAAQKAAVMEAKGELERANSLLQRKRVKPALDAFTKVVEILVENHAAMEEPSALVEAYLKRGAALFLMGREEEAAKGPLVEALRLDPAMKIQASEEYGAPYVDLLEKVRGEIAQTGTGSLRVDTTPPGALVWVDGKEALTSPVLVSGLVPGTHYVTIKLPSTDAYTEKVRIEKDALYRITPDEGATPAQGPVSTLVAKLSQNRLDDEARGQVASIAKAAGADLVVIGGAYADGAEMGIVSFLYSAKENAIAPLQRIALDREMLGAAIELNKVSNELLERTGGLGTSLSLPSALAQEAKAGAEKINEVDFTVDFASLKEGEKGGARAAPGPVRPKPTGPRRPVGGRTPVGGGASAPTPSLALDATPSAIEEAPAPVAEEPVAGGFLDFKDSSSEPAEEKEKDRPSYSYSGGVSIADEVALDERTEVKKDGGLLSKWWFWTGAAVVIGGAVTAGAVMAGGGDHMTATAKW